MVRPCSYHAADLTKAEGAFSCKDIRCPYVRISGFKPSSFSLLMVLLDSVQRTPSACLSKSWWRCRKNWVAPFPPNKIFYTYERGKKGQIGTISYCVHTSVAEILLKWTNVTSWVSAHYSGLSVNAFCLFSPFFSSTCKGKKCGFPDIHKDMSYFCQTWSLLLTCWAGKDGNFSSDQKEHTVQACEEIAVNGEILFS